MILNYGNTNLINSLISYWKFEGNSNDVFNDYNGIDTNINYISGKINQAASFNGLNSYISINNFNFGNSNFSFSFWLKRDSINSRQLIFGDSNIDGNPNFLSFAAEFTVDNLFRIFFVGNDLIVYTFVTTTTFTDATNWHYFTIVRNLTNVSLYVDSVLDLTTPFASMGTLNTSPNNFSIGRSGNLNQFYFYGKLDEFGVWNRALIPIEIRQLYNNGIGKQYPFSKILAYPNKSMQQNLIAAWNFDGNLNDVFGNRNFVATGSSTYSFSNTSRVGQSLSTNGNLVQFSFTDTQSLTAWTYSIWIRPEYVSPVQAFVFNNVPITDGFYIDYTNNYFRWYSSGFELIYPITYSQWYHIALVKSGTSMNMYANGSLFGTSTAGSSSPMIFRQFGYNGFSTYLSGQFDALNIYDRDLSTYEIQQLYNGGAGIQYPFPKKIKQEKTTLTNGLFSYWRLGSNSIDSKEINNGTDLNVNYTGIRAEFSATSCYVEVGQTYTYDFMQSTLTTSVCFHCKLNDYTDNHILMGNLPGGTGFYVGFYYGLGIVFEIQTSLSSNTDGVYYVSDSSAISDNNEHFYVITSNNDTNTVQIFKDNVLLSGIDYSAWITGGLGSTFKLRLGAPSAYYFPDYGLNGSLRNVGIWNRVLTTDEITYLYNNNGL